MNSTLEHHGILGQKWGVRRTPAQLGHLTSGNGSGGNKQGSAAASKNDSKKTPGKSSKKPRVMTDEELRQRINRLNMEEQYDNLVARQKTRNTGPVKKLLGEALENLGRKALGVAVDKVIEKISNKDKFDIDDWKDEDVNKMDADTIQKVAKWYQNARVISTNRASMSSGSVSSSDSTSSGPSNSSSSGSSSRSGSSSSSSGASRSQQNRWVRERRAAMRRLGVR